MRLRKLTWSLTTAAGLVALSFWVGMRAGPAGATPVLPEGKDMPGAAPGTMPLAGTASCSARGCHGALEARPGQSPDAPVQLDEFTKWVSSGDPHTRAFEVLSGPRSRDIAKHLDVKDARADARCLACHTNPWAAELHGPDAAQELLREEHLFGVGCESCHGHAGRWVVEHLKNAWKDYSSAQKQAFDMVPVHDTVALAQACAGCHVGAPPPAAAAVSRDVNHDLIAAGHPRLAFDLGAFLANLPPHWNTKARRRSPEDDARAWAVGQVASAQAALRLLGHRCRSQPAPWPEFAEYDCFACHHDLTAKSWRQSKQHYGQRLPASLPWGDWYFSMPALLAGQTGDQSAGKQIDALKLLMARPLPDRMQVASQAQTLARSLEDVQQRLAKGRFDRKDVRALLLALDRQAGNEPPESWDAAEQLFQAAWALHGVRKDPGLDRAVQDLTPLRAFADTFDSPRQFRRDEFREVLSKGLKHLGE